MFRRPILFSLLLSTALPAVATVPPKAVIDAVQAQASAAERGDPEAMASLGWRYFDGDGMPRDRVQAVKWFRAAAAKGNVLGTYGLALCLVNGYGVAVDTVEGNRLMRLAAESGNGAAQASVGYAVQQEGNLDEARSWYEKSAGQRNPVGLFNLAIFYRYGRGVPVNEAKAYPLFLAAAELGDTDAMVNVADMLEDGLGVSRDLARSREWYRQSALLGNGDAMVRLGRISFEGDNAPVDETAAAQLFAQAAALGNEDGTYWLGVCYEYGKGVHKDEAKAVELYRQVSTLYDTLNRLLVMQVEGRGMPRDRAAAYATVDQQIRDGKVFDMLYLAVRLVGAGDETEAQYVLQRALSAPAAARENIKIAKALVDVGRAYRGKNQIAQAERFTKDALTLMEKLPDVPTDTLTDTLDALAVVYQQAERPQQAEPLLQRSLELLIKAHGEQHASVADAYSSLSGVNLALDQYAKAEHFAHLSLAVKEALFGTEAIKTAKARGSLAQTLYFVGKYEEAGQLFGQSLAALEAELGKDHPQLTGLLNNMAYNDVELGRADLAHAAITRANAIADKFDDGKPNHAAASRLNSLGFALLAGGRYREAEDALSRSLTMREQVLGPQAFDVSISLVNLGKLYIATARYAKADSALQRALAIVEANASDNWDVAAIVHEQGQSQQKQGHQAQAALLFRRALAIRLKVNPSHPWTRATAQSLASLYRSMGQEPDALQVEQQLAAAASNSAPVAP